MHVVGNKADLIDDDCANAGKMEQILKGMNGSFHKTSAKSGTGIEVGLFWGGRSDAFLGTV